MRCDCRRPTAPTAVAPRVAQDRQGTSGIKTKAREKANHELYSDRLAVMPRKRRLASLLLKMRAVITFAQVRAAFVCRAVTSFQFSKSSLVRKHATHLAFRQIEFYLRGGNVALILRAIFQLELARLQCLVGRILGRECGSARLCSVAWWDHRVGGE